MAISKKDIQNYVDKATNLAEEVKRNIQHDNNTIDNRTVIALNDFIIAANEVEDLISEIKKDMITYN